jgi:hypothetical protein
MARAMKGPVLLVLLASTALATVEIGRLRDSSATLRYLDGNCTWTLAGDVGGRPAEFVEVGPQITLGGNNEFRVKCAVNETEILHTVFTLHEKERVPSPTSIILDVDREILQWSHMFQPSGIAPDFELTTDTNVSYLVYVRDRDSGETGEPLATDQTSLNISHLLDYCRRLEFAVQALVNGQFSSPNSTYSSEPNVPVFTHMLAVFLVKESRVLVLVAFSVEETGCLSELTIAIEGQADDITLNVSSSDRERGELTYDLSPLLSPEDVCSVRGVVYGGNHVGDSSPVYIQPPRECPTQTSTVPSSTSTTAPTSGRSSTSASGSGPAPSPTPSTASPSQSGPGPTVIVPVVVVVLVVIVTATTPLVIVGMLLCRRQAEKKASCSIPTAVPNPMDKQRQSDKAARVEPTLKYEEVVPCAKAGAKKLTVGETLTYVSIDHTRTEQVRQEFEKREEAGIEEGAAPGDTSIDPKDVGLSVDVHLDLLLAVLVGVKGRWFELGMSLRLSENFLDETETNIETEEECLSDMLRNWLTFHEPRLETLNQALASMSLPTVAFSPSCREFVLEPGGGRGEDDEEREDSPALPERD